MPENTFEKDGVLYWANPDLEIRINGIRQLSPATTFESACKQVELADVVEQEVYSRYVVGEDGEEDYILSTKPLVIQKRTRISVGKDTRYLYPEIHGVK
tara:strand:- start:258 stop:554 length:297 start_codon:yes stop_codon:yes gene_type:complete